MADWLPNLLALAASASPPAAADAVGDALRERIAAWLAGAETHAPALLLGLALLLAVPPLALAGLAARRLALDWIQRQRDTRAVAVTAKGRAGLRATFGIDGESEAP